MGRGAQAMVVGGLCSAAVHAIVLTSLPSIGGAPPAAGVTARQVVHVKVVDVRVADVARPDRFAPGLQTPAVPALREGESGAPPVSARNSGGVAGPKTHFSRAEVDVPPLPKSAPNEDLLDGVRGTGLPVRLRVFVESDGTVSAVKVLHVMPGDEKLAAQAREMFLTTGYLPARRDGEDVAAYVDVEVALDPGQALIAAPN